MRVALIGYGKMGQTIESILVERKHEVVLKLNRTPLKEELIGIDVAIEFSFPESAYENIKTLVENNINTISGTTGWTERIEEIESIVENSKNAAFLYASNFSLGVNIFFELNAYLAKIMDKYPEYKLDLEEVHHTQKLDAPSGTAITIADKIIQNSSKTAWTLDEEPFSESVIPIKAKRIDEVPGTHTVNYTSEVDTIQLSHIAHSRKGFAYGAVIAAEWIHGKKGVFTMNDVLNKS